MPGDLVPLPRRLRATRARAGAFLLAATVDVPLVRRVLEPVRRIGRAERDLARRRRSRRAGPDGRDGAGELVVVSPHLDDAVLSCTGLIEAHPGTRVVTAYTAGPARWEVLTAWDEACGFLPGDDVMAVRKREDVDALATLGAGPVWLDLVEGQYEPRPTQPEVAARLRRALEELRPSPTAVAIPLGVSHPDHVTVSDAMLGLWATGLLPEASWLVYGELPYVEVVPRSARRRKAALAADGRVLRRHRARPLEDRERKRAAIARYQTQLRPLGDALPRALAGERLWRLTGRD